MWQVVAGHLGTKYGNHIILSQKQFPLLCRILWLKRRSRRSTKASRVQCACRNRQRHWFRLKGRKNQTLGISRHPQTRLRTLRCIQSRGWRKSGLEPLDRLCFRETICKSHAGTKATCCEKEAVWWCSHRRGRQCWTRCMRAA